jgi:hypothetical protein
MSDAAADADVEVQRIMSAGRSRRCGCSDEMMTRRKLSFLHIPDDADDVCKASGTVVDRSIFNYDVTDSPMRIPAAERRHFSDRRRMQKPSASRKENGASCVRGDPLSKTTHRVAADNELRTIDMTAVNVERNRPSLSLEKMQVVVGVLF